MLRASARRWSAPTSGPRWRFAHGPGAGQPEPARGDHAAAAGGGAQRLRLHRGRPGDLRPPSAGGLQPPRRSATPYPRCARGWWTATTWTPGRGCSAAALARVMMGYPTGREIRMSSPTTATSSAATCSGATTTASIISSAHRRHVRLRRREHLPRRSREAARKPSRHRAGLRGADRGRHQGHPPVASASCAKGVRRAPRTSSATRWRTRRPTAIRASSGSRSYLPLAATNKIDRKLLQDMARQRTQL